MLKAAFYEIDITPSLGDCIPGQFYTRHSSGILDPLYAKALVLEDGGKCVAIVSVDCVSLSDDIVADLRARLFACTGIDNAMFAATHTHQGGPVKGWGEFTVADEKYINLLINKCVDAVTVALDALQPVTIRVGRENESGIAFYRRFHMKDGSIKMNPGVLNPDIVKPAGIIDPDVIVLCIDDLKGNVLGVITNFSCHLDTVGGDKISADYPGELSRILKCVYGQQMVSLFLPAPCGNINHIDVSGKFVSESEHYKRMGRALAGKVIAAIEKAPVQENNILNCAREKIECTCRQPTEQDVKAAYALIESEKRPYPELVQLMDDSLRNLLYANEIVSMYENPQSTAMLDIMALRIGNVVITTVPAELFVEFGLDIKAASKFDFTMISSLTNGAVGYVITRDAMESGGYESWLCSNSKMSADTGYMIVATTIKLFHILA